MAEEKSWFNSILDKGGELLGGVVDIAGEAGGSWLEHKLAPPVDEQRKEGQDDSRNTVGEPLPAPQPQAATIDTKTMLIAGGVLLVAVVGVAFAVRGK